MSANKWHWPVAPYPWAKQVPSADGAKLVKPTITHARRYLLLPSVTSIVSGLSKGAKFEDWQLRQSLFKAVLRPFPGSSDAITHEYDPGEIREWQNDILRELADDLEVSANEGKEVHGGVEDFYRGLPVQLNVAQQNIINAVGPDMEKKGVTKIVPEETIGGPEVGFVGTPDMVGHDDVGKIKALWDIKTCSASAFAGFKTESSLYQNWRLQQGGYCILLGDHHIPKAQILSDREGEDRSCKIIDYSEGDRWSLAFRHEMISWFYRNDYYPWKLWEEDKGGIIERATAAMDVVRRLQFADASI